MIDCYIFAASSQTFQLGKICERESFFIFVLNSGPGHIGLNWALSTWMGWVELDSILRA